MVVTEGPWAEFGTLERSGIPEQIATRLLEMVKERKLRPGDKLPPERELAALMQLSRPSLREALRALAMMGVVTIRQGDGIYISSLKPELLIKHLESVVSVDDSTFLELFEARKLLEAGIAELAAERISDEELEELDRCLGRCAASVRDPGAWIECDLEFHKRIMDAASNPIVTRFMASVRRLGLASRSRTVYLSGVREQSVADHGQILAALKAHDPQLARQAMVEHLNHLERRLRSEGLESPAGADGPPE